MATIKDFLNNFINTKKPNLGNTFTGATKPVSSPSPVVNQPQKPAGLYPVKPTTTPTGNLSATNSVIPKPITPTVNSYGSTPKDQFINNLPKDYAQNSSNNSTNSNETIPVSPTPTVNPYQQYIDSFNKRTSAELLRTREREDELRKNEKGQLERGQQYQLGEEERLSNRSLADLAIAKAPTLDLYNKFEEDNKPVELGGQLYQKQQDGTYKVIAGGKSAEGFTLGKDQVRYDAQGNVIAGNIGSGTGTGFGDSASTWAKAIQSGQAKLSDVPQDERAGALAAMSGIPQTTSPQQQRGINQANVALQAFEDIFNNPALERGAVNRTIAGAIPGTPSADLKESIKTVQALIGFDELQKMRDASPTGGALGQVSEREIDFLQQLAGSLKTRQSDEQLIKNLKSVQKSFEVLKLINSPDGTQGNIDEIPFTKTGSGLFYEAPDGSIFERLPDGNLQKADFNSVGKTTASNIPQRNKNPGNIKQGGLADKLAIGIDKQGHLIFPDEATGFKAMQMDIEAKLNGKSRYLPANPTIAELGKVYAEDPNWGKKVASILGVSTATNTKMIPINNLVQAIARQEGYYA